MQAAKTDQTGWMPRLISVFAGRTYHCVGFVMLWLKCLQGMFKMFSINDGSLSDPITMYNSKQINVQMLYYGYIVFINFCR